MTRLLSGSALIFLLSAAGCNRVSPPPMAAVPASAATAAASPPAATPTTVSSVATEPGAFALPDLASPWKVSNVKTASGVQTLVSALSGSGRVTLYFRETGGKVECILGSGEALDSFDAVPKSHALVKYRFDDGEWKRSDWTVSQRATSLMLQGDAMELIAQIRRARRLEVEFARTGDAFDDEAFNIALFPEGIFGAAKKTQ